MSSVTQHFQPSTRPFKTNNEKQTVNKSTRTEPISPKLILSPNLLKPSQVLVSDMLCENISFLGEWACLVWDIFDFGMLTANFWLIRALVQGIHLSVNHRHTHSIIVHPPLVRQHFSMAQKRTYRAVHLEHCAKSLLHDTSVSKLRVSQMSFSI